MYQGLLDRAWTLSGFFVKKKDGQIKKNLVICMSAKTRKIIKYLSPTWIEYFVRVILIVANFRTLRTKSLELGRIGFLLHLRLSHFTSLGANWLFLTLNSYFAQNHNWADDSKKSRTPIIKQTISFCPLHRLKPKNSSDQWRKRNWSWFQPLSQCVNNWSFNRLNWWNHLIDPDTKR